MTYERKPVTAPRLSGTSLKAVLALAERPVAGQMVRNKMLSSIGLEEMRNAPLDSDAPVPFPLHAAPARVTVGNEPPAEMARRCVRATQPLQGFQFETIGDFAKAYRNGETSPEEVARTVLAAIDRSDLQDPPLRAFIACDPNDVMSQAQASAKRLSQGAPRSVLDGVPIAIKDEVDQVPYPTTVGTCFLGKGAAASDATAVARLRAAGALLIGKANMHEIGLGTTGINPHHGTPRNPYEPGHATGGSSSGSAAAVAAGLCPVALGADGGGSIRIPASFCGVVGLKPTFGRVSEYGAAPLCWSVAHLGPIGATASDTAAAFAVISGKDSKDPHTLIQPNIDISDFGARDLNGIRLGIFRPWFRDADKEIVEVCEQVIDGLRDRGATLHNVEIPELDLARTAHLITIASEMAASQARNQAQSLEDYGLDTRMNLVLAGELRTADYVQAQRIRGRTIMRVLSIFSQVDALVTPATACTAPPLRPGALRMGESNLPLIDETIRFATLANLTGVPAISFPAGYNSKGLPIGLQAMGKPWSEAMLLQIALVSEQFVQRQQPARHTTILSPRAD